MRRSRVFNIFLFFISFGFFAYLFYIQCIKHDIFQSRARSQHEKTFVLVGARGNIYDRNGLPLATSQPCFSVFCTPQYARDQQKLMQQLAQVSGRSKTELKKLIKQGQFFWLDRKIDVGRRDEYLGIDDPSIGYTHDLKRKYNMAEIFTALVGMCGSDNIGIEGLEAQFDDILSGETGFATYQRDPTGDIFPYHNYPEKDPHPGRDVYLTIDLQFQSLLHAHLKESLIRENAHHAAGVIIEPKTGDILALVNVGQNGDGRNHVVCDEFEPGSTFKLLTLTYALLDGFTENDVIDTEGGKFKVRGHVIHDYRDYGKVTFKQAIAHSSNVAMVKVAKSFDRDEFCLLIRDFGLGQLTGVDMPGEVRGRIPRAEDINDIEFATMVFGQGLTVNLLQLAFAYQAVANDGILMKPNIIKEIKEKNRTVYNMKPLRVRRVIEKETADRVTDVLCGVVEEGSGIEAGIDGVLVAGKTGTAQKVVNGTYSNRSIITTFIGFFPADEPEYLIAILFDEPQRGMWASTIAAPVFRDIAQSIYQINSRQYAVK
ncbi:MAG: penicillin-binding protein 2 [candidate division WOR-3 bacterium]|nr:MAG: penicillin-binding protein 2 [candidate division WOR-3 bacterium]